MRKDYHPKVGVEPVEQPRLIFLLFKNPRLQISARQDKENEGGGFNRRLPQRNRLLPLKSVFTRGRGASTPHSCRARVAVYKFSASGVFKNKRTRGTILSACLRDYGLLSPADSKVRRLGVRAAKRRQMSMCMMRNLYQSRALRCTTMLLPLLMLAQSVVSRAQSVDASGTPPDNSIKIGERLVMHSAVLQEDRPYLVYLPKSYQTNDFAPMRYPVLYLLDGDYHFHSASGVVQYMGTANEIPEMIVVAIPNTQRTRDLTPTHSMKSANGKEMPAFAASGGGTNFLRFLSEELIPQIERQYRTEPYRILVGHSFGGLFAMYTFLHQPQTFQAYVAIDPSVWWDDQLLCRQARAALDATNHLRASVYISLANNPLDAGETVKFAERAGREFAGVLQSHQTDSFRCTMQYFESEDHGSVPLPSLYYGLRYIFDGFKPSSSEIETVAGVRDHYAKVSTQFGFAILPPEQYINETGWNYLSYNRQTNTAFEFLNLNLTNYPDSRNVHESLAEAYEFIGNKSLAAENFKMALKANPENRYAAERLRRLKPRSEKTDGPVDDGVYRLINKANGKSLEAVTNSVSWLTLRLVTYAGEPRQQWRLEGQGDGYYQITSLTQGKALDDNAFSLRNGAAVILWSPSGRANQSWQLVRNADGSYRMLNEYSGMALQFAKPVGTNSPSLRQGEWRGQRTQEWLLKPIQAAGK